MIKNILKNKLSLTGGIIVVIFLFIAIFAPYLSLHDPSEINVTEILLSPSKVHPFGTDALGRDVFSRMLLGTRVSLLVGFISVGISIFIGLLLGSIAGYYGGIIDSVIMRFVDIMLSIPTFFLILAVIAILEPNLINIMIVIGFTSWMGVGRLVRGQFLSLKQRDYVSAAKTMGMRDFRIIVRHILPNALSPVYVAAILGIAGAILIETALSFLGLGVQPPTPSWGNILTEGKDNLEIAWWLTLFPGLAILITVLGYNLFGEGLRDILDPRLKGKN